MIKRILLSVLIILFFIGGLKAQRGRGLIDKNDESTNYLILSLGPEYCISDVQNLPTIQNNQDNFDLSLGYRKLFANNFAYKVAFNYSYFTGNDNGYSGSRKYSYKSKVVQFAVQGEYHIKIGREYYYRPTPNSIYIFAGAGMLRSDANLNIGNDYRDNYKYKSRNVTPSVPFDYSPFSHFGLGYQYNFNNNFLIGAEFNYRYTFSDFIDGFKPPKEISTSNDVFGGFSITLSYLLGYEYLKRN